MTSPCEDCPNFGECVSLCPALEKLLPDDLDSKKYSLEIPVSDLKRPQKKEESGKSGSATIDDIVKIDPAAGLKAETDLDVQWQRNPLQSSDLFFEDYKKMGEAIDMCIFDEKKRLRFKTFLKCAKITQIAIRANTSKQNIHKQFLRICTRIGEFYARGTPSRINPPHQIKKRYRDLKPAEND